MSDDNEESNAPRTRIPSRVALSGGGLRAAHFQLGGFLALALRGELMSVNRVGTISGGTLTGLALRQARAQTLEELPALDEVTRREVDLQLTVVARAEALLYRCTSRDLRASTLLAPGTIPNLFGTGWEPTLQLARELNRIFTKVEDSVLKFDLAVGVHDLATHRLMAIPVTSSTDVGTLAAAAMSMPGLMESIVLQETGHACCDGGIDDKTAVRVLPGPTSQEPVLILDASAAMSIDATKKVSPLLSLLAVTERHAEKLRENDGAFLNCRTVRATLRNTTPAGLGLDDELVRLLQATRTDLNGFSAPEQLSLAGLGFILTLNALGESRLDILERAARLVDGRVYLRGKVRAYPFAHQFAEVCGALLKQPSLDMQAHGAKAQRSKLVILYERLLARLLRGWSVSDSLRVILAKSEHVFMSELQSQHPFFKTRGIVDLTWAAIIAAGLLWPAYLLVGVADILGAKWGVPGPLIVLSVWVLIGLAAFLVNARDRMGPKLRMSAVPAVLIWPAWLAIGGFLKLVRTTATEGDLSIHSLRFPQSTLGRIANLLFYWPSAVSKTAQALWVLVRAFVVLTGVVNPFFLMTSLWPSAFNVDAWPALHGAIVGFFLRIPINPAVVLLLSLELGFELHRWALRRTSTL